MTYRIYFWSIYYTQNAKKLCVPYALLNLLISVQLLQIGKYVVFSLQDRVRFLNFKFYAKIIYNFLQKCFLNKYYHE